MAILRLLFPIKFSTTLIKGTHPCKISRLDFSISQSKAFLGLRLGQQYLGGQFGHFGQHEHGSTNDPKCD
jgi:hypothetical protein